tara:strand:- start:13367 stop:14110 length:744 start_codon:yes stop_codon:yes gene_type:complete
MTNNCYQTHGIEHLSASFLNSWVSSPWQAIGKLAGLKSVVGASAYRGTSAENGLEFAIKNNNLEQGIQYAEKTFDDLTVDLKNTEKEKSKLASYVQNAYGLYSTFPNIENYQQKIVYQHPDIAIPFIGYIDFLYETQIRDLKTVARNVYSEKPSVSAARQVSIYAWAYPQHELWIDYVTPKEVISHRVYPEEHQKTILKIVYGLEKFLSISKDTKELANILTPDPDDWRFNDGIRQQCNTIWDDITI